jgi:O-antigen/teichoic acid export membrane protein
MATFRSIASVTALLSGGRLAGVGMSFLTQLILARQLAPEELGLFFLSSGIATALSVFTALGYPNLAARILARARGGRGQDRRDAFLGQARRDMAIAGLLAMLVTLGVAVAVWDLHHAVVIGLGLLSVPPLAQIRLLSQVGNADRRMALAYLPELVLRPAGLLAAVALAAVFGWPLDATGLIIVFVVLSLLVVVWMQLGLDRPGSRPKPPAPPRRVSSAWRRAATPLILVTLFTAAFADASVAVAGFFLGLADLAVFTLALKIAWLGGYAIQTIHQAVLADLADAVQGRRADRVAHSLVVANRLGLVLSLGFVGACWLGGDFMLAIFGRTMPPAAPS